MDRSLSELIGLSRTWGSDIRLVWKGGGNISVKNGDRMYIKASGTELGRMNPKQGWRKVNLIKVRHLLDDLLNHKVNPGRIKTGLLNTCCDGLKNAPMPSIETFFHALLGRYVIHLHPMAILPYLCSREGCKYLKAILSPALDFQWIAFQGLGVVTAGQVLRQIGRKNLSIDDVQIFFLSNHGLIVSGSWARQVEKTMTQIISRCEENLPPLGPVRFSKKSRLVQTAALIQSVVLDLCDCNANRATVPVCSLRLPNGLVPRKEWFNGIITPEELTYLGGGIVWCTNNYPDTLKKAAMAHFRKTGLWPKAFFVRGQGLFISEQKENLSLYRKVFAGYLQIRGSTMQLGGLKLLPRKYLSGEGL